MAEPLQNSVNPCKSVSNYMPDEKRATEDPRLRGDRLAPAEAGVAEKRNKCSELSP